MSATDDEMTARREAMVCEVATTAVEFARKHGRGAISPRVLAALREVPRHLFVPPEHRSEAYFNRPVPIGYGQTISQPFIVALMTEILDLKPGDRVLEVGTGSGYQAAVLSRLVDTVFTIEISAPLAARARGVFAELALDRIQSRVGDGYLGWPEAAPFDAILVAAAPPDVPPALIAQLAPGGRLAIPVGEGSQQLILVEKRSDQSTVLREIIPVCFVPLTRQSSPPD